ncbi:MAG: FHA domain-containing protein [Blastochloris sp.]|nr:FHA domain-containing protein [Blastochloris sp.]
METKLIASGFGAGLFPLTEMLQHYGHTGRTGCFLVKHEEDLGKVHLMTGIIAHAETSLLSGDAAMFEILSWPSPSYDWIESETPDHMTMSSVVQDFLLRFIQAQGSGELEQIRKESLLSQKTRNIGNLEEEFSMSLEITSKELRPFTYKIKTRQVRIGRHADNDLVLSDSSVSRKHAILVVNNDDILVRDLGSMNGISINGQNQTQGLLHHGDLLRIGEVNMDISITPVAKIVLAGAA